MRCEPARGRADPFPITPRDEPRVVVVQGSLPTALTARAWVSTREPSPRLGRARGVRGSVVRTPRVPEARVSSSFGVLGCRRLSSGRPRSWPEARRTPRAGARAPPGGDLVTEVTPQALPAAADARQRLRIECPPPLPAHRGAPHGRPRCAVLQVVVREGTARHWPGRPSERRSRRVGVVEADVQLGERSKEWICVHTGRGALEPTPDRGLVRQDPVRARQGAIGSDRYARGLPVRANLKGSI